MTMIQFATVDQSKKMATGNIEGLLHKGEVKRSLRDCLNNLIKYNC